MNELDAEKKDPELEPLSKKDLINNFLLFRVGGSLVLLAIWGFIANYLDSKPGPSSELLVGIGVITIINVPIQIYYLFRAILIYRKNNKK